MRKIYQIIIAVISIVLLQPAFAQKETPPAGGKAKDFKLSDKKVQTYPNGFKTTMVQYGNLPKVTVNLVIKTGNAHEQKDQIWLANLMGRMLREGTSSMDFAAISKKAAMMGGNLNVSVGLTETTISGSVLSEYAGAFIKLISDVVINPAFPVSELERLKSDYKRQLATQKAVPQQIANEQFVQAMYGDHRYGKIFPSEEMINSFTVEMVREFYNKNVGAKRSVLYVAGKFDDKEVISAVNNSFSKWTAGPDTWYPPVNVIAKKDTILLDRKDAPQTTLMVGLPIVSPNHKDYMSLLVTNALLGGSFGSRITTNIREDKGYTYSPFSSLTHRIGSSVWYEQADVTSEHTINALLEIEKEIKRLQLEAPSKDELDGIKNYLAGIFVLQNSSPAGIIGQLNFLDVYGLDDNYLNNYVKNIYAITPEKVSQTAKTYIQYDKMTKVMVGDKTKVDEQIKQQQSKPKTF